MDFTFYRFDIMVKDNHGHEGNNFEKLCERMG
jgi:hypothetical protein